MTWLNKGKKFALSERIWFECGLIERLLRHLSLRVVLFIYLAGSVSEGSNVSACCSSETRIEISTPRHQGVGFIHTQLTDLFCLSGAQQADVQVQVRVEIHYSRKRGERVTHAERER